MAIAQCFFFAVYHPEFSQELEGVQTLPRSRSCRITPVGGSARARRGLGARVGFHRFHNGLVEGKILTGNQSYFPMISMGLSG